jgi:hypothetical protein
MPGFPLAFFSKKLNPAQQKYSEYDRELLAIYEAVNISTTCAGSLNLSKCPQHIHSVLSKDF